MTEDDGVVRNEGAPIKLPYHTPKLTEHGSIADLTKTGVGNLINDNTSPYNVANQS